MLSAVALYWVEQQADAEKQFTYVGDLDLAAAILADLQETQEQEFAAKLKEIVRKVSCVAEKNCQNISLYSR